MNIFSINSKWQNPEWNKFNCLKLCYEPNCKSRATINSVLKHHGCLISSGYVGVMVLHTKIWNSDAWVNIIEENESFQEKNCRNRTKSSRYFENCRFKWPFTCLFYTKTWNPDASVDIIEWKFKFSRGKLPKSHLK